MEEHICIGIEGLVGSGKTSICRELLNRIPNSILLQGGNLYRGIVYAFMQQNKNLQNLQKLKESLDHTTIDIKQLMDQLKVEFQLENRETVVYINGNKISEELLQSDQASLAVSIAANKANNQALYLFFRTIIKEYLKKYNVILSGRATMEIYPDMDVHILVTASLEERVKRKSKQYHGEVPEEQLREHIIQRDKLQEQTGFYKQYDKTVTIDVTDCNTVEASTDKVMEKCQLKQLVASI